MKHLLALISILTFATAARAEFTSVALTSGDNPLLSLPARAVAIQVVSTNATGTVELVKVATHEMRWEEPEIATTTNYVDVTTNLYHLVTNDIVTVWRTRTVGNGVVETNVYAQATNETPAYPEWPNLFVTTNKVVASESYTNWTYQAVGSVTVATNTVSAKIVEKLGREPAPWDVVTVGAKTYMFADGGNGEVVVHTKTKGEEIRERVFTWKDGRLTRKNV